jgi:hypothetical protein
MTKPRTHFPQVPVEIAKKAAAVESREHATEVLKSSKKGPNGNVAVNHNPDEGKDA